MGVGTTVGPVMGMRDAGDSFGARPTGDSSGNRLRLWAGDEFSFDDLLDLVNPLQHIPIVSNIYRSVTGDKIGAVARAVGGGLLGGPLGAVAALVNSAVESSTGKDLAEHAVALVTGEETLGGDGAAPLVASMGERGDDPWTPGPRGAAPANEDGPVQTAARGVVEIDGLPWLQEAPRGPEPVQAAAGTPLPSAATPAAAREIGAAEDLPWLADDRTADPSVAGAGPANSARDPETAEAGPGIADAMMGALDKYKAMMRACSSGAVDSSV